MAVSEFIVSEGHICLVAAFMGMLLGFQYDCIRIFRRVFPHRHLWTMSLEDILYWIMAAFQVFGLIYEHGDGVIRLFLVVVLILGALLYRCALGKYYVLYVSRLLNLLLKPLKNVVSSVTIRFRRRIRRSRETIAAKKRSQEDEVGVKKREGDAI